MSVVFSVLMALTMLAVLGTLALGVFSMVKGGAFNCKYGNRLMRARVMLQAAALVFFALTLLALKK